MSQVTLQGNASGTGIFTVAAPNSNTNRTVNLPDAGGDVVLADATQTLTNKSISGAQINSGTVVVARLGSGTANSGSYLRGDQTWQPLPFTFSDSANGYQQLPGGFIMQWGFVSTMDASFEVTFPLAFTEVYSAVVTQQGIGDTGGFANSDNISALNTSTMTVSHYTLSDGFWWMAVGKKT
jgi:hypothetical protein